MRKLLLAATLITAPLASHAMTMSDAVNALSVGETPKAVHQILGVDTPAFTRVFPSCAFGRLLLGKPCMVETYRNVPDTEFIVLFYGQEARAHPWTLTEIDDVPKRQDGTWDLSDLGVSATAASQSPKQ